jgi:hypothetical protein
MQFSVHIEGGELKLDDKLDCRVCLTSEILLGEFVETPTVGRDPKPRPYPVKMDYSVLYIPMLSLYLAIWKMQDNDLIEHRSIIMPWQGGLPIQFKGQEHLELALRAGARRILSGQYLGGQHTNERTVFQPYEGLVDLFRSEGGGGVALATEAPSSMQAAPVTEAPVTE